MSSRERIACLGAGRMGRGIAVVFAYAGHPVTVVDFKARPKADFDKLADEALGEVRRTLESLATLGLFDAGAGRDHRGPRHRGAGERGASGAALCRCRSSKACRRCSTSSARRSSGVRNWPAPKPIIASTTSTILVDDLSSAVANPERFLNAHWLNPAYLVPLVELSPGAQTAPETTEKLKALLERIGKVPVVCAARPGYIVPRIQALAMNEAARMVEEGVASPEELDKAIKYGFGFRFAVLGLLEFIDWGGGDILYYASRYLTGALGNERYQAPEIIERNMKEGRIGLTTRQGFLNYEGRDLDAYRAERMKEFIGMLGFLDLVKPPVGKE